MDESSEVDQTSSPRFCDQCGLSLIALNVPHVSRNCPDCGKSIFLINPGKDGKGIQVEPGDTFTIPAGWLTISLDPSKSRGAFSRPGINWFVEHIVSSALPTEPSQIRTFLDSLDKQADDVLEHSTLMPGIDPNSHESMERAFERFKDERDTTEWHALLLSLFRWKTLEKLDEDSASKEGVAFFLSRAMAAYAMLIYKRDLETHVWAGYEQMQLVYDIAAAATSTPTEARAIEALRPAFTNLSEDVLAAWVDSGANISEKLGIKNIDASVVNALAKYHLAQFDRKRQAEAMLEETRGKKRTLIVTAASAGAAIATAIIALLAHLGVFTNSATPPPTKVSSRVSSSARISPASSSAARPRQSH
jgi:hypothetical protein